MCSEPVHASIPNERDLRSLGRDRKRAALTSFMRLKRLLSPSSDSQTNWNRFRQGDPAWSGIATRRYCSPAVRSWNAGRSQLGVYKGALFVSKISWVVVCGLKISRIARWILSSLSTATKKAQATPPKYRKSSSPADVHTLCHTWSWSFLYTRSN